MFTCRIKVAMLTGEKPPAAQCQKAATTVKKEAPKALSELSAIHFSPPVVEDKADEVEEEEENSSDKELETSERLATSDTTEWAAHNSPTVQCWCSPGILLGSKKDEDNPDVRITPKHMCYRPAGNTVLLESPSLHKKTDTRGKTKTQPGGNTLPVLTMVWKCSFQTPCSSHETFWMPSNTKTEHMFTGSSPSSRMLSFVDVQELKGPYSWVNHTCFSIISFRIFGVSLTMEGIRLQRYPTATQMFSNIIDSGYNINKRGFKELVTITKAVGGGPAAGLHAMADKVLWSDNDDMLYQKNCLVANKGGILSGSTPIFPTAPSPSSSTFH
ncbi:hypothetical protein C8Q80DRAFT_1123936 [Daedaleopsis nitida]|nr:hypothetical protein C8Q80DRAFT_1123936 [Daedaleopsis nitida]